MRLWDVNNADCLALVTIAKSYNFRAHIFYKILWPWPKCVTDTIRTESTDRLKREAPFTTIIGMVLIGFVKKKASFEALPLFAH